MNNGRNLMNVKKYDRAILSLNKAMAINDKSSSVYYLLGLVEARQYRFNAAIRYLKIALRIKPENPQYQFDLALCYMEIENYAESEKLFNGLLETHPDNQSLFVYVSDMYYKSNRIQKAIDFIESIPESKLTEPYLIYQLAQYYQELNTDTNKIFNLLDKAIEKALLIKDKQLIREIEGYKDEIQKK